MPRNYSKNENSEILCTQTLSVRFVPSCPLTRAERRSEDIHPYPRYRDKEIAAGRSSNSSGGKDEGSRDEAGARGCSCPEE